MSKDLLNQGQQAASDAYFNFLMDDSSSMFLVSGGPGTGKTFLMKHLIKKVMEEYSTLCSLVGIPEQYSALSFTSTTHASAEVLEQAIGAEVSTIHSFLGLKVKEDYRTGKTKVEKTHSWKVRSNFIVFIDEYSMIDTALFEIIKESFVNSKIVFVGDHCQMAPINEKTSPVLAEIEEKNFAFLSEPVRNANYPALVKLTKQLRESVETGVFQPIEEVPGVIDYLDDDQMIEQLDKHFKHSDPDARILCYTNTRVENFNNYIREIRGLPLDFMAGDKVVSANTYMNGSTHVNVERKFTIIKVLPEIYSAGYGHMFMDNEPVTFRHIEVQPDLGAKMTLPVPVSKERWLTAIRGAAAEKNWGDYFELKALCVDLRFQHACTVYKSQGSTYDTVFIDIGNIGTSYDREQVARMLLVGASRPKSRIFLFGQLPSAYRGG